MNRFDTALARLDATLHPPALPASDVAYALHDTSLGRLVVAVDAAGSLVACSYDPEAQVAERLARTVSPRVLRQPARLDDVRRQIDEYVAGTRRGFDLATSAVSATPFARTVLAALARVPYGATTTYHALATAIGAPRASRAVGNALGANPLVIVVPCHRVLRGDGSLGGYAGGLPAKRALLALEAAHLPGDALAAPR